MMRHATTFLAGFLFLLAGCAGSAETGGEEYEQIDMNQVASPDSYQSALEVISELRPGWLDGQEAPEVYIDGERRSEGVKELERLQPGQVRSIRLYRSADQPPEYVANPERPAIVVRTGRGS